MLFLQPLSCSTVVFAATKLANATTYNFFDFVDSFVADVGSRWDGKPGEGNNGCGGDELGVLQPGNDMLR